MNMQTNIPSAGALLAARAMLASLNMSIWTAKKTDKKVTREVHTAHNAKDESGAYRKALIAKSALEGISAIAREARDSHHTLTLPWLDDGARLLPAKHFLAYTNKMRGFRERFEEASANFMASYPQFVEAARADLAGMFDESDYPDESSIKRFFDFGTRILPVPSAGDFRVDIGKEAADDMRRAIETATSEALAGAQRDAFERIAKTVGAMADKLAAYKPAEKKGERSEGVFRDSLVGNVRDLVAVLPAFDLANSPDLQALIAAMETQLCAHDAEDLRTDESARNATAEAAAAILAKANEFLA